MYSRNLTTAVTHATELPTLPDIAYAHLRERILQGVFPVDTPLRQERIAKDLGISRLPVRDALSRLESDGLVVFRPRRGYTVASLDIDEIKEVFDLRMVLEEHAGRVATEKRTEEDLREVEAIFRKMEIIEPDSSESIRNFSTYNRAFHERLFSITRNKRLCSLLSTLHDNSERFTRMGASLVSDLHYAHEEHRKIFEAFKAGNAPAMALYSRDHARQTGERLMGAITRNAVVKE